MKRHSLLFTFFALITLLSNQLFANGKAKELYWEDLIPKGYSSSPVEGQSAHNENSEANWVQPDLNAPIVKELNNTMVTLPGFVVPLEGNDEVITEFLLVPYFGACIHVPPPPPNQIVHVTFKDGVPIESLYDAISVTGKMKTESWEGELAKVGYRIEGVGVAPFDL
ncbi:hypothetical protein AN214_03127 [Pseudoalteromonas sp. P1-9]|uniref:DUF3299 domain-containing protein n=1 Tax=Pseudoalteromonas sp. P1-9 TaxID=1710354 RepID=UPI0006D61C30|nr:DUF3299 domain-containing protein [Pseudoalteromonas sp. P1-9]KPV94826.1 hypothetical protein AN214_03127 [Pseudoalteromonas sp. P1-9]